MNLDDLEKLCAAATPGPWRHVNARETMAVQWWITAPDDYSEWICEKSDWHSPRSPHCAGDGAFIAAARTYMPKLIAVAREARGYERAIFDTINHGDVELSEAIYECGKPLHKALAALEQL